MSRQSEHGAGKRKTVAATALLMLTFSLAAIALPQNTASPSAAASSPRRIHLILKDGSYQLVLSYKVSGKLVRYVSAERGGDTEEIPIELVDLDATHRWEKQHTPDAAGTEGKAPAIDPELLKEEEERSSLTPTVAPNLQLPEEDSVLALDEFQGTPELVPLVQTDGDLDRTTSHSVLKKAVNPHSAPHQVVTLRGVKSHMQLHVDTPVFYLRIGDDAQTAAGGIPLIVDTHGASSVKTDDGSTSANSRYVIVQADVRTDARVIASFNLLQLTDVRNSDDVIEMKNEALTGGHWLKLTPARPLAFGEYVLMEVLSQKEINVSVWDFGVHPNAPENRDAVKPQPKRRPDLERRKPD